MDEFDIRDYIWNVFEISRKQKKNIYAAFNMFITNVAYGHEKYDGAIYVHYKNLNKSWEDLTEPEKDYQRKVFKKVVRKYKYQLRKAWNNKNRLKFHTICFKPITSSSNSSSKYDANYLNYGTFELYSRRAF